MKATWYKNFIDSELSDFAFIIPVTHIYVSLGKSNEKCKFSRIVHYYRKIFLSQLVQA